MLSIDTPERVHQSGPTVNSDNFPNAHLYIQTLRLTYFTKIFSFINVITPIENSQQHQIYELNNEKLRQVSSEFSNINKCHTVVGENSPESSKEQRYNNSNCTSGCNRIAGWLLLWDL